MISLVTVFHTQTHTHIQTHTHRHTHTHTHTREENQQHVPSLSASFLFHDRCTAMDAQTLLRPTLKGQSARPVRKLWRCWRTSRVKWSATWIAWPLSERRKSAGVKSCGVGETICVVISTIAMVFIPVCLVESDIL